MINRPTPARPAAALILTLAVAAVACGEQQATLPIEPAGPRPATSTTTEPEPEQVVEVVEVPTATPATTEPEAVPVAVPVEPAAEPAPGSTEEGTVDAQSDVDGVVVMNTWLETTTAPATTEAAHVTTTTAPPATTTTTAAAPTTTVAPTTTAAPATTTTTSVVPVTTIAAAPTTTTTTVPAATTTTVAGEVVAPPIPRPGDPDVPEVNEGFDTPVQVDLSWFPERRNVISWEEWNRVDEANTPEWARLDYPGLACPPRNWWSYPMTIQVGTVLANVPRGADCFSSDLPQSYVVTRMWHVPVCETREQRNCVDPERDYAHYGVELWKIVICGYTFEGEWNDFGTRYQVNAVRLEDGRFRVVTYGFHSQRECNK